MLLFANVNFDNITLLFIVDTIINICYDSLGSGYNEK